MQSLVCFFYLYSHLCGPDAIPLDISVASDIPLGAGLGSSAALSVCLSAGLLTIQDLTKSCIGCKQDTLPKICTKNTEMSCERLKLICDFAYISEQILHGRPSGIDNTTSTYGGLIQFSNFEVSIKKTINILTHFFLI
jgi:mevalonate kinase